MGDHLLLIIAWAILAQPFIGLLLVGIDVFFRSKPLMPHDSQFVAFAKALGLWGWLLVSVDVVGIALLAWRDVLGKTTAMPQWMTLLICWSVLLVAAFIAFNRVKMRFDKLSSHQMTLIDKLKQIREDLEVQRAKVVEDADSVRATVGRTITRLMEDGVFDCEQAVITRMQEVEAHGYTNWQGNLPESAEKFLAFISVMSQKPEYRVEPIPEVPQTHWRLHDGITRVIGYVQRKIDALSGGIRE